MKTTIDYLNAVKAKTGAASDYALQTILNTSKQNISSYRNGKTYFDEAMCLKVASVLELPAFEVLLSIQAERTKNQEAKAAYKSLLERLGGVAASALIGIMLNSQNPAQSSIGAGHEGHKSENNASDLYIIRNRKRRIKPFNPLKSLVESMLITA